MKRMMAVVLSMALAGSVIAAQAQQDTATAQRQRRAREKKRFPKQLGQLFRRSSVR